MKRLAASVALALLCAAPGARADFVKSGDAKNRTGAEETRATPSPPLLTLRPLRDAGGLNAVTADGQPLNLRLTESLQKYLQEAAANRYRVQVQPDTGSAMPSAAGAAPMPVQLTLEGDLSHVESSTPDGGYYLCALRLFREGDAAHRARALIGQWAGVAESLRYLTGNLRHDPRVDKEGLTGELGKRIIAIVTAPATNLASAFAAFADEAAKGSRVQAVAVPFEANKPTGAAPNPENAGQIMIGNRYQVRVTAPEAGTVFLLRLMDGHPQLVATAETTGAVVLPQEPLATTIEGPQEQELVALLRRKTSDAPLGAPMPVTASNSVASNGARSAPSWAASRAEVTSAPDTVGKKGDVTADALATPVVVVGSADYWGMADRAITHLLHDAATAPPGTWSATRLKVRLLPKRVE